MLKSLGFKLCGCTFHWAALITKEFNTNMKILHKNKDVRPIFETILGLSYCPKEKIYNQWKNSSADIIRAAPRGFKNFMRDFVL